MTEFLNAISQLPAGFWAVLSTLAGGVVLKITEKWLNKNKEARENRDELRTEIEKMRTRIDKLEEEADDWRKRYYLNEEEIAILRAFIRGLGQEPPARQGTSPLYDETKYKLVPVDKEDNPDAPQK